MRKAVAMAAPAFGVALLAAGTAFAVTKMCPGNCRGASGDGRGEVYGGEGSDRVKGSAGAYEVHGGPGDDLVRAGGPGRPNDGARNELDCGDGADTAYYVEGQDVAGGDCEIVNPPR